MATKPAKGINGPPHQSSPHEKEIRRVHRDRLAGGKKGK